MIALNHVYKHCETSSNDALVLPPPTKRRRSYSKQTEKLKSEGEEELERMRETYSRQIDAVQSAVGQTR